MLCLNSILYILIYVCSLLVFKFLHILSWYRKLSRDIYMDIGHWTMDIYSYSYISNISYLLSFLCYAGIVHVFIFCPIHFPPSDLPAKCWPCVDICKSGRSCNSPSQCLVSNSCIFAQACNISMSRARETELTDLQPAHMLQLLLHANKNFESDSTLRDRHINFIQQIISSSIVSSTVYVRVNILFPQLRFLEKRKRTKCQKTQPTMTDVVFVLKQSRKPNKEYLHSLVLHSHGLV